METGRFSVAAIGFGQAMGLAGTVFAQKQFQTVDCRISATNPFMCVDNGCPPPAQCENQVGSVDIRRCSLSGQLCQTALDCPTEELCQHVGEQPIDGCFCDDPTQPVKCALVMGPSPGSPNICVDFDCRNSMPGFFCDPMTCDCVPEIPPQATSTPTVTPTVTPSATATATATPTVEVFDHLKCYLIKDPNKLKGVVDLDSPQFGLEPGCKIKKAKKFCVPVKKTVDTANTFVNKQPVMLMAVPGQDLVDDYICYKVVCDTPPPPDTKVMDQFGTRTLAFKKAFEVCVPARKVP